jgi:hypothetical protein
MADLTDAQWALIEPFLRVWKAKWVSPSGYEGGSRASRSGSILAEDEPGLFALATRTAPAEHAATGDSNPDQM